MKKQKIIKPKMIASGLITMALIATSHHAAAESSMHAVKIPSTHSTIKIDGTLNEEIWKKAIPFDDFYQHEPVDKIPAKVKTEVRIAYDDTHFYIAVKAFDPNPTEIRAPYARRDKIKGDQDFLGLYIDSMGSKQAAPFIFINPRGAVSDGNFNNTTWEDFSPDLDFESATAIIEDGWIAEVKIPLASLPYKLKSSAPWNLLVFRNQARDQRIKMFGADLPKDSGNCMLCYGVKIEGMEALPSKTNWSLTPQLVLRSALDQVAGKPDVQKNSKDLSLDLKVRPNSYSSFDATINPDFSQIELDAAQLSGNSQFGLFVPEKRPFFLEGSDMLLTPMRVISTRSITDPSWGARYTQRTENLDLTVMTTRDAGGGLVMIPGAYSTNYAAQNFDSQASIARANWRFENFTLGGVVTDRTSNQGRGMNRVVGSDFSWQRTDNERIRGQILLSNTNAQLNKQGQLVEGELHQGNANFIDWTRDEEGWGGFLSYTQVSQDFRADNGFIAQAAYRHMVSEVVSKYKKFSIFNSARAYFHAEKKLDLQNNTIATDVTAGLLVTAIKDTAINLRMRPNNMLRAEQGGRLFKTPQFWLNVATTPSQFFSRITTQLELGDQVDISAGRAGKGGSLIFKPLLRPFDWLEIEPSFSTIWVNGDSGAANGRRLFTERIFQLNGIYHISSRDTVRLMHKSSEKVRNPAWYQQAIVPKTESITTSLVYGHTRSLGNAIYLGLTLNKADTPYFMPLKKQREFFVKLSMQF
jgi:hypothetical protein